MKGFAILFSGADILLGMAGTIWAFNLEGAMIPGIICSVAMLLGILGLGLLLEKP